MTTDATPGNGTAFVPHDRTELVEFLRGSTGLIRVRGAGTTPPSSCMASQVLEQQPTPIDTRQLDELVRLDPDDLTCSFGTGIRRTTLDAALAQHGLRLPVPSCRGTLGGLFARGGRAPLAAGAPSPRTVLLGLEGTTSDGLAFKCGAPVVKSVAGFDLHRAFVGSRGTLFIATLFHTRVVVAPRAAWSFEAAFSDAQAAIDRFEQMRRNTSPVALVFGRRREGEFYVAGRFEGSPRWIDSIREGKDHGAFVRADHDPFASIEETESVLAGFARPSRVAKLAPILQRSQEAFVLSGSGEWMTASNTLAAAIAATNGHASTTNANALAQRLRKCLDPSSRLTA